MANTDLLTGLGNRNAFNVALNNLEALPDKTGIGIVIIDLDDLKQVNDSLGHPAGDEYIRAGGSLAQRFIEPSNALYRVGGDEFAAFIRQTCAGELSDLVRSMEEAATDFRDENGAQ